MSDKCERDIEEWHRSLLMGRPLTRREVYELLGLTLSEDSCATS